MALIRQEKILNDHEVISHVILTAMCTGDSKRDMEIIESWMDENGRLPDQYDVILTVNGTELNVESFFNSIWEQYEKQVRIHAAQIVDEQTSEALRELIGKISDAREAINYAIENINWNLNLNKTNRSNE